MYLFDPYSSDELKVNAEDILYFSYCQQIPRKDQN